MSFGFRVRKETWTEPADYDELPERLVLQADLLEISPVVWPAYKQSEVSLLRADNASAAARRIAERQARMEAKFACR